MRETVSGVRSVEVEMADPERAARFYVDVWKLSEVVRDGPGIYLRGTGPAHHILALYPSNGPAKIRRIVLEADSRAVVDRIHERLRAVGGLTESPGVLDRIDGGYGFGFADPAGRAFAIVSGSDQHADGKKVLDRPHKIAHVNLNDPDADATVRFFVDAVGFRLIDRAGRQAFLNADCPDHSSLVICQTRATTLNHLSFEMMDLDSVMRGAGRMQDHGYPIEWGVGRHGCANNVFAYFAGPEEIPIEYTSDIQQIDESYVYHGPDYWAWPEGRLDQWGVTPPHTMRWKRIQNLFEFARNGYQLRPASRETIQMLETIGGTTN